MQTNINLEPILGFLNELRQNNNKTWFDKHRPTFESARKTYEQFINDLIDEFRASDNLKGLLARDCIARIYRDIHFSRDKSPYKTNFGAIIAPGGWKSPKLGYYISIEPQGKSMVASGLHMPMPGQLDRFRQSIVRDATTFKKITHARNFVETFGTVGGDRLKTAPKGYDRTHPEIALLQLKQITVAHLFSDQEVLRSDFEGRVVTMCRTMKPFLDYLSSILQ
jgi:uncharacterized protein (TIGR02453 family)